MNAMTPAMRECRPTPAERQRARAQLEAMGIRDFRAIISRAEDQGHDTATAERYAQEWEEWYGTD